jgi:hypothetical protein
VKHFALVSIPLVAILLAASCGGSDIDNKEAVRSAMVEYLDKTKASTGLDPAAMDVKIDAVSFERDTAHASVAFLIKGTEQGMRMNYTLTRQGNKWGNVQKQSTTTAPHGLDPVENPPIAVPTQEPLLPVPLPGTQPSLPVGHPPVDSGAK